MGLGFEVQRLLTSPPHNCSVGLVPPIVQMRTLWLRVKGLSHAHSASQAIRAVMCGCAGRALPKGAWTPGRAGLKSSPHTMAGLCALGHLSSGRGHLDCQWPEGFRHRSTAPIASLLRAQRRAIPASLGKTSASFQHWRCLYWVS